MERWCRVLLWETGRGGSSLWVILLHSNGVVSNFSFSKIRWLLDTTLFYISFLLHKYSYFPELDPPTPCSDFIFRTIPRGSKQAVPFLSNWVGGGLTYKLHSCGVIYGLWGEGGMVEGIILTCRLDPSVSHRCILFITTKDATAHIWLPFIFHVTTLIFWQF